MSQINVNTIRNRTGGPPNLDKGAVVTGILTCTGDVTVGGTLTYEDVTNIDSVGLVTAKSGIKVGNPVSPGIGATIDPNGNAVFAGIVTATNFEGKLSKGNTEVEVIDTGSDGQIKMTTEGGERVRIGPAGQIGLGGASYGMPGNVITSAGSGSAPTWSAIPPGGNTATLVADGAIAAGKPCIVKTDGKAAQIAESINPTDPPVANGDQTVTDIKGSASMAYHKGLDKYVIIGKDGDAFWITGENNAGNTVMTFSSQFSLLTYSLSACMACYHESQDRVIFLWWNSQFSAATSLMVATHGPNLNSASDFNANNSYQIGNRARPIATVYYPQVNVCCFMVNDYDSNLGILYMLDTTTSNTVADNLVNKKATITLDASATIEFGGVATNGTVIVAAYKKGSNSGVYYKIITGTNNTTYTVTSEATFDDSGVTMEEIDITYDTNAGKFVLVYKMTNNYLKAVVGTLSGTGSSATISWGTPVQMSTDAINQGMSCEYDPSRKETLVVYSTSATGYFRYVSISGTTPTWDASGIHIDGSFYPVTNRGNHFCINVNPDTHQMAVQWQTGSGNSGSSSRYELITGASVTSNMSNDKRNFIGFAEDAISDGATGEVKLRGNVVGNQSGLTPGTMYEVQNAGTLTANWQSNSVGLKAIAADKGIVSENTGV